MKRTTKRDHNRQPGSSGPARGLGEAELARVTGGDVYMHNPRGSNDPISSGSGGASG